MKRFVVFVALVFTLALAGCVNHLPKPVNANGSVNASVTVGEAWVTYTNATRFATTYVATCHATPSTMGCNENTIAQLKGASTKALDALVAAQRAVDSLPPGAEGIDRALANLNAALLFLQALTKPLPHVGFIEYTHWEYVS